MSKNSCGSNSCDKCHDGYNKGIAHLNSSIFSIVKPTEEALPNIIKFYSETAALLASINCITVGNTCNKCDESNCECNECVDSVSEAIGILSRNFWSFGIGEIEGYTNKKKIYDQFVAQILMSNCVDTCSPCFRQLYSYNYNYYTYYYTNVFAILQTPEN